jgi:hypothetical protein
MSPFVSVASFSDDIAWIARYVTGQCEEDRKQTRETKSERASQGFNIFITWHWNGLRVIRALFVACN